MSLFLFLHAGNKPGCGNVLIVREDKYLSCPYSPTDASNSNNSTCEGITPSTAVAMGGPVVWQLYDYGAESFSVSSDNFTSTYESSLPPVNISSSSGELYIQFVQPNMRRILEQTTYNCSVLSAAGEVCSVGRREVEIYIPGKSTPEKCTS